MERVASKQPALLVLVEVPNTLRMYFKSKNMTDPNFISFN